MTDFDPSPHEPTNSDSVTLTVTLEKYEVDGGVKYVASTDIAEYIGIGEGANDALESLFTSSTPSVKYAAAFNDES